MIIIYKKKHLRIAEVWMDVDCPESLPEVDILRFCACLSPIRNQPSVPRAQNLLIDLTQKNDTLLSQMEETTRKHIRRADTKDNLEHCVIKNCSNAEVENFCNFYDEFAKSRKLRPSVKPRLDQFADQSTLVLTSINAPGTEPLARHAYIRQGTRATLLYTASMYRHKDDQEMRKLMARANQYLHWKDMLYFKEEDCLLYELGGVDITGKNEQTSRITRFKLGFGGYIASEYSCTIPKSLKGHLACSLLHLAGIDF